MQRVACCMLHVRTLRPLSSAKSRNARWSRSTSQLYLCQRERVCVAVASRLGASVCVFVQAGERVSVCVRPCVLCRCVHAFMRAFVRAFVRAGGRVRVRCRCVPRAFVLCCGEERAHAECVRAERTEEWEIPLPEVCILDREIVACATAAEIRLPLDTWMIAWPTAAPRLCRHEAPGLSHIGARTRSTSDARQNGG
jgi:hypothetical protein